MLKIGITGGIGSGKSTVVSIFATLGIPVLKADQLARNIMLNDPEVRNAIIQAFGADAYIHNNINNAHISQIVFKDPHQLAILNSIVHPATIKAGNEWALQQHAPYIVKEAAIFFESGSSKGLDGIIGVSCPRALRIKRVMDRDHITSEQVIERMNQQIEENLKMKLCDWVIKNDEQSLLIPQVLKLHHQFIQMTND